MSTTHITDFFSLVSNPKDAATIMEMDGSVILVRDLEPGVLSSDYSHIKSSQEGLMMAIEDAQCDDMHSCISVNE